MPSLRLSSRIATPADASAVTALLVASYGELLSGAYDAALLKKALPLMTRANLTLLRSGAFYVIEAPDQRIIGCGGWSEEKPGSKEVEAGLAHMRHFATHPQHVRRGVARALAERCLSDAATAGNERFECYATLMSEGFYRSLGFETIRPIEVAMSAEVRLPAILMARSLR